MLPTSRTLKKIINLWVCAFSLIQYDPNVAGYNSSCNSHLTFMFLLRQYESNTSLHVTSLGVVKYLTCFNMSVVLRPSEEMRHLLFVIIVIMNLMPHKF